MLQILTRKNHTVVTGGNMFKKMIHFPKETLFYVTSNASFLMANDYYITESKN